MGQKWSIRAYKEGDEQGILELSKAVHPDRKYELDRWMKQWRWMYKDSPAGASKIWLAEHNGKIVGHESLTSIKIQIGNEIVKVFQAVNLLVHPDYRYQGMFLKLERTALDEAEREGVHITIGFPNKAAYPGHMKLGWFDVSRMQLLLKPLNWEKALKLKIGNKLLLKVGAIGGNLAQHTIYRTKKAPVVEDLTITRISSFDDRIDDFWSKLSNQHKIMVIRNKDYLNWRYSAPDVNHSIFLAEKGGEICGYIVLRHRIPRHGIKVGRVFDLIAESEEVMHCLVSRAIEDCYKEKVDLVLYNLIANQTYRQILKRNGFILLPFIKDGYFCAYSSSPSISKEILANPQNWLIQTGDSDAI